MATATRTSEEIIARFYYFLALNAWVERAKDETLDGEANYSSILGKLEDILVNQVEGGR